MIINFEFLMDSRRRVTPQTLNNIIVIECLLVTHDNDLIINFVLVKDSGHIVTHINCVLVKDSGHIVTHINFVLLKDSGHIVTHINFVLVKDSGHIVTHIL